MHIAKSVENVRDDRDQFPASWVVCDVCNFTTKMAALLYSLNRASSLVLPTAIWFFALLRI
jgi:hypothetical protein